MNGKQSLSRAILNQGGIKNRFGGNFHEGDEIASLYDRTGSLQVARTLDYYNKKPKGQKGMILDPGGRVFRDQQDKALQATNEGSGSHFQNSLAAEEKKALISGAKEYNYTDPKTGEVKRIALGQGAGSGGAGAGNAGGSSLLGVRKGENSLRAFENALDGAGINTGKGSFTEQGAQPGTSADTTEVPGDEGNWWQNNQGAVGSALGDITEGYANIAPHLANMRDYKNLPGVQAPMLQKQVPLERPNLDAYKQSIIAQGRNMQNQAGYDSAQSGSQAGQRASALSSTQSELSKLAGYEGNLRADISNKEKLANAQIEGRNLQSVNTYYDDLTERDLYQTRGIANERNQISKNILGFVGGQRTRQLDRENMALVKSQYAQQGYMNRAIQDAVKRKDWEAVNAMQSGNYFTTK